MDKKKAIVCTILYVIALTSILTASWFVKSKIAEINLYQLIMCAIGSIWVGNSVVKFYDWLIK